MKKINDNKERSTSRNRGWPGYQKVNNNDMLEQSR